MIYAQKLTNGEYHGAWAKRVIVAKVWNENLSIKKWKGGADTLFFTSSVYDTKKFTLDGIDYAFSFNTSKEPNSLILSSSIDTFELIKTKEVTVSGKVLWENITLQTYADNGQPANYKIYYYDTSKANAYPNSPDSMTRFKNDLDRNIFYLKHGTEYTYYPNSSFMVKEKRKWKNGKLIRTKYY